MISACEGCDGETEKEKGDSGAKEKINVTVRVLNYQPGLEVSTSINSGSLKKAKISNSGQFKLNNLNKYDKIFFEIQKPGYSVEIISPQPNPYTIIKAQTISLDIGLKKNEKTVKFLTSPTREGVKIFGSHGASVELLATTNGAGKAECTIEEELWSKIQFSYDYSSENKSGTAANSSEYAYNTLPEQPISIALFPGTSYTNEVRVTDGVTRNPIENCEISIHEIGNIARTNAQGLANISVASEDFIKADLKLDDFFYLSVKHDGYEAQASRVQVPEMVELAVRDPLEIALSPYLKLNVILKDEKGKALPGVDVTIHDDSHATDSKGVFSFNYPAQKTGSTIPITFRKKYYIAKKIDHKYGSQNQTINISMQSISQEVNIKDSKTRELIPQIYFNSGSPVHTNRISSGKYVIYFEENNTNYSIRIGDRDGVYEEITQNFQINNNTLGRSIPIDLHKKTSLNIQVNDNNGKPLKNVEIVEEGRITATTKGNGSVSISYPYTKTPKKLLIRKPKYKSENRQIVLNPGANTLEVSLNELFMNIRIVDNETSEPVPNVNISLNGTIINSGQKGIVRYNPESTPSVINYSFIGVSGKYLPKNSQLSYSSTTSEYQIKLTPQPVMIISTFFEDPFGNEGIVSDASIEMDGQLIGRTNDAGEYVHQVSALPQQHTFKASKTGFDAKPVNIQPNSSSTIQRVKIKMDMIAAEFSVSNLQGDRLEGIEIILNGVKQTTNNSGHAIVQLTQLNKPLDIHFIDPSGVYESVNEKMTFKKSGESFKQTLLAKPMELTINVRWAYAPAIGIVEIDPIPDPRGKENRFTLIGGKAVVNIYRPDTYTVKYTTTVSPIVSGVEKVDIDLKARKKYLNIEIPAAQMKILVDPKNAISVDVYRIDAIDSNSDGYVGTVTGNGRVGLDMSTFGYGEYRFRFKRDGWEKVTIKDALLNTPNQLFDFTIGDSYSNCIAAYERGNWEESCEECGKISEDDPDYCAALLQLSSTYDEKLNNPQLAANSLYKYITNMDGDCEKSYGHYENLFRILRRTDHVLSELEAGDNLKDLYQDYISTITYQLNDSSIKNKHIIQSQQDLCSISIIRLRTLKKQWGKLDLDDSQARATLRKRAEEIKSELDDIYSDGLTNSVKAGYTSRALSLLNEMRL